jgi:hypothetical protein
MGASAGDREALGRRAIADCTWVWMVAAGMAVTAVTATALVPVRQAGRGDAWAQPSSAANAARSST